MYISYYWKQTNQNLIETSRMAEFYFRRYGSLVADMYLWLKPGQTYLKL